MCITFEGIVGFRNQEFLQIDRVKPLAKLMHEGDQIRLANNFISSN